MRRCTATCHEVAARPGCTGAARSRSGSTTRSSPSPRRVQTWCAPNSCECSQRSQPPSLMHLCDGGRQASAYVRPLSDGGMKLPLGQQVIAEVSCTIALESGSHSSQDSSDIVLPTGLPERQMELSPGAAHARRDAALVASRGGALGRGVSRTISAGVWVAFFQACQQ